LRVAALYDVHGNVPALEAVLAEVERVGVDQIVYGGDIASGPLPRETVEIVRSGDAAFVRGNADRLDSPAGNPKWDEARLWVEDQLDEEQIEWLASLPFSAVIDEALYVHATPQDDETVITELTSDERLAKLLAGVEQPLVVAGHTHMQLDRRAGSTRFVNAGSVGMPYEGKQGAFWVLLDGEDVDFRHTPYAVDAAVAVIQASGCPGADQIAGLLLDPEDPDEVSAYFESIAT
jgi:putative phosphoesterase